LRVLQPEYETQMLIPVMDGFNSRMVTTFSSPVKFLDIIRTNGSDEWLSLRHTENILGEVFYADSRYSIFIQVADMLSYLALVTDLYSANLPLSPSKSRLFAIAKRIPPDLFREHIVTMRFEDASEVGNTAHG
jgi:hypothetical protein